ncbi:MAG: carboxylesterase family protein [Lachnospiraceae bacterium]|nr:carboxylesterase family protein [Lachnospiraceae bacterium]
MRGGVGMSTIKKGFCISFGMVLLLMLAVIELNKNTIVGWILTILAGGLFFFVNRILLQSKKWWTRCLSWFGWLVVFAGVLVITWPPVRAIKAVDYANPEKTDIVHVQNGDVQGVVTEDGEVEIYAGIPYAKAPVGELRWKEPQDPEEWDGVLLADTFAPMSMQPTNLPIYDSLTQIIGFHDYHFSMKDNYVAPVSEDSLYLNIWKPATDETNLPVVVYVHGGSLQTGQPWYSDYSGQGLARQDVIVVNMGYRLGVFGFLADEELAAESEHGTTGNYGLLDQIKALQWVNDNIEAFGGNPDNITLAGESAGAASVSALCVSPLASGLFTRAVLESSTVASVNPPHSFRSYEDALESANSVKERFGCENVEELRDVSAEELVVAADTEHHITIDGYVLEKTPYEYYKAGEHNETALMHGYNASEADSFLLFSNANMKNFEERVRDYFGEFADEVLEIYPASTNEEAKEYWREIWGAVFFDYSHYCLNRLEVMNQVPVYEYQFTKTNGRIGPWHSGEMIYLYGNIPEKSKLFDDEDRALSDMMITYYANFAKNGNPNGNGLMTWEENLNSQDLMEFGENSGMISEKEHALFAILDRMQGFEE